LLDHCIILYLLEALIVRRPFERTAVIHSGLPHDRRFNFSYQLEIFIGYAFGGMIHQGRKAGTAFVCRIEHDATDTACRVVADVLTPRWLFREKHKNDGRPGAMTRQLGIDRSK